MNSFKFISKIKSIFSKATQKPDSNNNNQAPMPKQEVLNNTIAVENSLPITPKTLSIIPKVPVNPPATAHILPKSLRPELPASDDNSLENHGLKSSTTSEGDEEVLKSNLIIVAQNFIVEAELSEEDTKTEYAQNIDQTNYKIIELNNKIANIQDEQIPEQVSAIEKYLQQMEEIQNRVIDDNGVLPETYTINQLAVANANEGIRMLKQKIQDYKSDIEQKKYYIDSLKKKTQEINMVDPRMLNRRMNIFFSGWVMGLQGLGWHEHNIQLHKQIFEESESSIIYPLLNKNTVLIN